MARALPFPFMLTARADQYLWGRPDLAEVIRRAQAFETAGANAIMVPGLSDHGHRCTRQLHRSLADVRHGGVFLDGRIERCGKPKRRRSSNAPQTTGAIPSAADIKRDALSIVKAREIDGASLWRSIVLQGLLLVGFREHSALKRVRTETAQLVHMLLATGPQCRSALERRILGGSSGLFAGGEVVCDLLAGR